MQGQLQHPTPHGHDAAVGVQRAEPLQQFDSLLQGACGRRVGPGQRRRGRAPRGQLQCQPGEVDLGDLGLEVGPSGAVFQLAPQPVGRARFGAPGATRPLLRRCPRGGHRRQPRHARALVEPGHAGQAGVHHHPHPVHREGGLGDVGGEHHPSPPGRRGLQRKVLFGLRQRPGQRVHVHARRHRTLQQPLHPTDLPDAGEEHQQASRLLAQRPLHQCGARLHRPVLLAHRRPHHLHRVQPAVAGGDRSARTEHAQQPLGVRGGGHRQHPQVGADCRPRIERQRQPEVGGQIAFVHLVEDHQAHAVQGGVVL